VNNLLTETQIVLLLQRHLENKKHVCVCKTGYQHGFDIEARNGNQVILIEAKGAKANKHEKKSNSKIFSRNQVKTHLAVAVLKAINMKRENINATVGIAHPDTDRIREFVDPIIPFLKKLSIKHYWVSANGNVSVV
jgi:hypothetical protein